MSHFLTSRADARRRRLSAGKRHAICAMATLRSSNNVFLDGAPTGDHTQRRVECRFVVTAIRIRLWPLATGLVTNH